MYSLVIIAKGLVEVAGMAYIGQGAVWLFAGSRRETNPFYRLFAIVTRPIFTLARLISPRIIIDRHMWLVVGAILSMTWLTALFYKACLIRQVC